MAPSPETVTFDELSNEIRDIAYERMTLGLQAFGLTLDDLDPAFAMVLAEAAGRQVAAEYAAAVNATQPVH